MTGPMFVLMAGCVFTGLAAPLVAPVLERAITAWVPELPAEQLQLAPLGWTSAMGLGLVSAIVAASLYLRSRLLLGGSGSTDTWGCGYAVPSATMQYTSSSFAEMLVRMFGWALRPKIRQISIEGIFAHAGRFESHIPDAVLDGMIRPLLQSLAFMFSQFRVLQPGSIQLYLSYIFFALLALMLWSVW